MPLLCLLFSSHVPIYAPPMSPPMSSPKSLLYCLLCPTYACIYVLSHVPFYAPRLCVSTSGPSYVSYVPSYVYASICPSMSFLCLLCPNLCHPILPPIPLLCPSCTSSCYPPSLCCPYAPFLYLPRIDEIADS